MKKLFVTTILTAAIMAFSSCGETAESTKPESSADEIESISQTEETTTTAEATTTATETTTETTTTTTAPIIEPIIDHEILTMEECFIKVVENDAQEKVTETTTQFENNFEYNVAITESGIKYILLSTGGINQCLRKMYTNNALTDINDYQAFLDEDIEIEHTYENYLKNQYGCDKAVHYRIGKNNLFESNEELTLAEILSRCLGTEITIEGIEKMKESDDRYGKYYDWIAIYCSYGIELDGLESQISYDSNHIYHINDNNDVTFTFPQFPETGHDAYILIN